MMVANFFDRSLAAAMEVLRGADPAAFRSRLSRLAVTLSFDRSAVMSSEGRVALEMATDLMARFYPGLALIPLDAAAETAAFADTLKRAARSIHPGIELRPQPAKVVYRLVAGATAPSDGGACAFFGSQGWTALVDDAEPMGCLDSGNPFGAAAAACLGVARAFRSVFSDDLGGVVADGRVEFDVLHQALRCSPAAPRLPSGIDLAGIHLVGLGAIGRSAAWTLSRVAGLCGEFHGVDHETIERSNLQRYVGATQNDQAKSRPKTRAVARMFENTLVDFRGHPFTWGKYLAEKGDCDLDAVAVALDTASGRIAIQASLPRRLLNAWTQPGDLGASRHDFLSGPCLACLYLPEGKGRSLSENIADALRLPEMEIREKLHVGFKVNRAFLVRVEAATGVAAEVLRPFEGEPLSVFYSKAVCGTAHFGPSRGGDRGAAAVPMAFQSALAGVLLAAEIIAEVAPLRTDALPPLTKINLLRPLGRYLTEPSTKHASGTCLCQDPYYVSGYRRKWEARSATRSAT